MPSLLSRLGQLIPGFTPRPTPPALVTETPDQRAARRLAELQQQLDRSRARPAPRVDERVPQHYYHGVAGKIWFLPAIDSATQDTPEIRAAMRLMIRDAYVKAAWEPLCIAVESEEWQVQPSESGNALAEEQAEFVTSNFTDYLKGGVPALVRAIIGQLGPDGFGLAEKVWDVAERGRLEGKIVLRAAKAKDPTDLHVKGDSYGNVTHVSSTRRQGDEFPITDFLYSRYPGFFDEPLGMSAFRASYAAYWMRDTVRKLRIIHTEKKMAGMLVGTYAEGDDDARATLSTALREAKSSTWMAIPEGCRVEAMQLSTASEPDYKSHDESLRDEIVTGIAFATLQTMTASVPGEGRGDSEVQKETSELAAWRLMSIVLQVVNEQLIPDLIDYNFPFPAAGGYPKLSFGAISKDDILKDQQVIQGAQAMGLTPSKKHYAKAWSVQLADPNDPDDQMQPGGPQMPPGGPGGGFGGGDLFGQPDPFGGGGSLFSEGWSSFAWQPAKSRTGSVKAVGTAEDAGRTLYGRQAEAALARQGRTDRGEPHPELPQEKAKRLAQEREPARAEARQAFARAIESPDKLTPADVADLGERMKGLTREELRGFARNLAERAGGLKPELVERLVSRVRVKAGGENEAAARQAGKASVTPDHDLVRTHMNAAPEAAKPYLDAALANAEGKDGRRLRKELASAHADAHEAGNLSPESDAAFGKAMESLGVKPIGEVGATVPFDPATMESAAGISSGTPVKVTRRGWSGLYGDAATGHENIGNNVRRAMVEPATAQKQPKQSRPVKPKAEAKPTTPAAPKENAVPKAANGLPDVKPGAEQKPDDPAYQAAGKSLMADDRFRKDLADAYNHQMLFIEHRDGLVGLSRLYHELQKRRPDVTLPQFHAAIDQLNRDRGVQLHILNEVHGATDEDRHAAIIRDDRFHNWVRFTGSVAANGRPQADPEKMRPAGVG